MRGRKAGSACAPRYHAEPEHERAALASDTLARRQSWAISRFPMPKTSTWWLLPVALVAPIASGCGLETRGTAEDLDASLDVGVADLGVVPPDGATDAPDDTSCVSDAGAACNSPAGCTTGTVLCDGLCNAPPDPLNVGLKCTTPKGCNGAYDCDGVCKGEPLSTGSPCTTSNGCSGKETCDGTCAGDPPNIGKSCATALGCTSKIDCAGACPESPLVGKTCTTPVGKCASKTACDGSCKDAPTVGNACTTANGCASKIGCDLKCAPDAPGVGTPCSVSGCTNGTRDCALVCRLPMAAKQPCKTKTCGFDETTDCFGVCPDTKRDTTVTCRTCSPCVGGPITVKQDECGVCPTCAAAGCVAPTDAGADTTTDTPEDAPDDDGASEDAAEDAAASG